MTSKRIRDDCLEETAASLGSATRRQALEPVAVADAAMATLEDASLLDRIIGFVAVHNNMRWERNGDASAFLKTIHSVGCVVSGSCPSATNVTAIKDRYGPQNQAFWASKLFQYFDFTVHSSKKLNFSDDNGMEMDHEPGFKRQEDALAALRRRGRSHGHQCSDGEGEGDEDEDGGVSDDVGEDDGGEKVLVEDFQVWTNLHVYYRASDYDFLTKIQQGKRPLSSFPKEINAYELFKDLAVMVDKLRIHAVDVDPKTKKITLHQPETYPCLLGQVATKITPRGSDLLELCGLSPRFWQSDTRMVSVPWLGLAKQAREAIDAASYSQDIHASEMVLNDAFDDRDDNYFVGCGGDEEREILSFVVYGKLVDWRHVRLNNFEGPQFYIGKRSQSSRWMGFISSPDLYD